MDDDELRASMRATMTITPPPPMESAAALAAGHRAVRRRAAWTTAGVTAVLVAAITVAVGGAVRGQRGDSGNPVRVVVAAGPSTTPIPSPAASWPLDGNGRPQQDATARSGFRFEQGRKVLTVLSDAVPNGWSQPSGSTRDGLPLRDHQAAVEGDKSGNTWSYQASVAVARQDHTGRLLAEVHTPHNGLPTEPCALAQTFWGMHGSCRLVTTGSARVGVVSQPTNDNRLDQWAAYRYADGTVVFVAQSRRAVNGDSNLAPLTTLPLTADQLAALAVNPGFHLA